MPPMLRREPFSPALLDELGSFRCGDEPWALDLADWISSRELGDDPTASALAALANEGLNCRIWVWREPSGTIVGFGSLGDTTAKLPNENKSPRINVSIIPALAVHSDQQSKGYGRAILEELLDLAMERADERPFVMLMVHVDNPAAQALYRRAGFLGFGKPYAVGGDPEWVHQKMYCDLLERRTRLAGIQ